MSGSADGDWAEQGLWYGYPPCCIGAFIIRAHAIVEALEDNDLEEVGHLRSYGDGDEWSGSGFVPCPFCRETIKQYGLEKFVASEITPRRECPEPFPKDWDRT